MNVLVKQSDTPLILKSVAFQTSVPKFAKGVNFFATFIGAIICA